MAINIKNLFAPLGICQIVGLVLGIIVFGLGIASRPYEGGFGRGNSSDDTEFNIRDFFDAHDAFFFGILLPLLFSIFCIVLTLLDLNSKDKIVGAGIHALIGAFCFVISIYLLYAIVTIRDNHKVGTCDGPRPQKPQVYANSLEKENEKAWVTKQRECAKKYSTKSLTSDILKEFCDDCLVTLPLKFGLCVAAGVFGFIYALLNIGTAVLVFLKRH